jgi:hypothetical protein
MGEFAKFRLELSLNELGEAFLLVDAYISRADEPPPRPRPRASRKK